MDNMCELITRAASLLSERINKFLNLDYPARVAIPSEICTYLTIIIIVSAVKMGSEWLSIHRHEPKRSIVHMLMWYNPGT